MGLVYHTQLSNRTLAPSLGNPFIASTRLLVGETVSNVAATWATNLTLQTTSVSSVKLTTDFSYLGVDDAEKEIFVAFRQRLLHLEELEDASLRPSTIDCSIRW